MWYKESREWETKMRAETTKESKFVQDQMLRAWVSRTSEVNIKGVITHDDPHINTTNSEHHQTLYSSPLTAASFMFSGDKTSTEKHGSF